MISLSGIFPSIYLCKTSKKSKIGILPFILVSNTKQAFLISSKETHCGIIFWHNSIDLYLISYKCLYSSCSLSGEMLKKFKNSSTVITLVKPLGPIALYKLSMKSGSNSSFNNFNFTLKLFLSIKLLAISS